jgi:hypothetical protein
VNRNAKNLAPTQLVHNNLEAILNLALTKATAFQLAAGEVLLSNEQENQHIHLLLCCIACLAKENL